MHFLYGPTHIWKSQDNTLLFLLQIFNILCEQPETVAAYLVPRARTIAARGESSRYIRFLTLPRAFMRFVTAPLHANRFFSPDGDPLNALNCIRPLLLALHVPALVLCLCHCYLQISLPFQALYQCQLKKGLYSVASWHDINENIISYAMCSSKKPVVVPIILS